jgi:putative Ca2+/H+ antiporter (TMEM165/GDT1 family)
MAYVFTLAYSGVFLAELVGDKLMYTVAALSTQYRRPPVFLGITAAFMAKMLVAVAAGQAIGALPSHLVRIVSTISFFALAVLLWFKRSDEESAQAENYGHWPRAAGVAFAAVFFSEWADPGQITAATLSARYGPPAIVWLAATLAMLTKGTLAMTLGLGLRKRLPQNVLRYCGAALLAGLGVMSVLPLP